LLVQYSAGSHGIEARENLATLYEADKTQRHRALQIYQQLLLNDDAKEKRDFYQFKVGAINLKMGRLDQARFEFRTLLEKRPNSTHLPQAYYLIGYSYFLEDRFPLALVAFKQTIKDFPGTPIADQAQFFVADTLEEKGDFKAALAMFRSLRNKTYSQKILDRRIKALRARMRKGVR
jgi:TolA-binding protein